MKSSTEYSGMSWCIDLSGFAIINSDGIQPGKKGQEIRKKQAATEVTSGRLQGLVDYSKPYGAINHEDRPSKQWQREASILEH